ncbi:MAG: hypothetical protein J6Y44_02070, partial [Clostridia bacterium]|nr:hypothetical protein [Clostridia bacterium]
MGKFSSKLHAISANVIIIPAIIIAVILHAFIIANSVIVNNTSQDLSQSIQEYGECSEIAKLLQEGSSMLSETSTSFVMSGGNADASLLSYINEYEMRHDRRGEQILAELAKHDILTDKTDGPLVTFWNNVKSSVEKSNKMIETQLRAIKIVLSLYPRTAAELHS